jgi:ATP-dependent DNA helicase RecQ
MDRPTLADARAALKRYFGYDDFRAAQLPAIESVVAGRDSVIVLPTGGGKSICFQVPALCLSRMTVVVSPLISLMADQVQALERRGIGATFLNSTLSPDETAARVERIRRGEIRLLYVAPERLAVGSTTRLLSEVGVGLLAIDEAHCVSEWGQDFRPSYLKLPELRRSIGDPQTVALTATATPGVRRDIARLLELRTPDEIVGGFDRPNLAFRVQTVQGDAERNAALIRQLRQATDPCVVYAATRRQVEQVARILSSGRVNAVPYHAGLPPERRARAQDAFMNGTAQVIVATNAFGMGIDKPDVRLVLHYIHSGSLEDYYQEAGRAGRDGKHSNCLLLFSARDRSIHDRMRQRGQVSGELLRRVWLYLAAMSGGRRRVPLDTALLSSRLKGVTPDEISRALTTLEERGLFAGVSRLDDVRVRLLASPLRIECERHSLSESALAILLRVAQQDNSAANWIPVSAKANGITHHRFVSALSELEKRQLLFVDSSPPRALITRDGLARQQLERTILHLRTRREAERRKLDSMVGYAVEFMCRRKYLLQYFGDPSARDMHCGECDVCSRQGSESIAT